MPNSIIDRNKQAGSLDPSSPYLKYVIARHNAYRTYYNERLHNYRAVLGGTDYKQGDYMVAYEAELRKRRNTTQQASWTQVQNDDGTTSKIKTLVDIYDPTPEIRKGYDEKNTFYNEKVDATPFTGYSKMVVNDYIATLYRKPPTRVGNVLNTDTDEYDLNNETQAFLDDVDGR